MDNKPNVFPTQNSGDNQSNSDMGQIQPSVAEAAAAAEMKRKTEEQIRLRDKALDNNNEMANKMHSERDEAMTKHQNLIQENQSNTYTNQPPQGPPNHPPTNNQGINYPPEKPFNEYIYNLSQPQMHEPFDRIPLPSEGKLYKSKKSHINVAYLTTSDEDILTSPNILESGDFIEILLNRKILEPELRYRDLHVGDRNAIMIWLRATGYGNIYPIQVLDQNKEQFSTEIDLNELKTIKLGIEPDIEGLFTYQLPLSKVNIKFKLLNVGEIEDLDELILYEQNILKLPVNKLSTYTLQKQIIDIDGNRDFEYVKKFISSMRVLDSKSLRDYINSIECGIDMNIEVGSPGGETIKTFLPLNFNFFWPDF